MIIHTVQPNETVYTIAEKYGVSEDRLVVDNQLNDLQQLVVGQTLIVLIPKETYQVREGDTLADIAASHGISLIQLLRNNPQLFNKSFIYPGEELIISFTNEKLEEISTNGYTLPFINIDVLQKTLPYLTYLTIFYYKITPDGDILDINDQKLIDTSREYGVAPIMIISTLTDDGTTDEEAYHKLLMNTEAQEHLINQVLEKMKTKGYYGLNIDMQNITQEDKQSFINFITNISSRVKQDGYLVFITLTPHTFPTETGIMYQGPEYAALGQLTDSTVLLSYEWGNARSPQPALPLAEVRSLLDYSVSQIPPEKITIGLPIIGYIWQVPFIPNHSIANAVTLNSALSLAGDVGAVIQHDNASEAPYFSYTTDKEYIVWFRDVRSISAILDLVSEYGLEGIATWNIIQFSSGMWLMINDRFEIKKVLQPTFS